MRYKGVNILLVEDSPVTQYITNKILSEKGANVSLAQNGIQAVMALKNTRIDYIIMDISMPIMNGYEAIEYIKSEMGTALANIPILALTGYNTDEIPEKQRKLIEQ